MKSADRIRPGMAALFALSAFLVWGMAFPYILASHEQLQLLPLTMDYFLSSLAVPGGLADYLGEFAAQFGCIPWLGAAVTALLLLCVQQLCARLVTARSLLCYALTFLPSALLCASLCLETSLFSPVAAMILVLGGACLIRTVGADMLRRCAGLLMVPVLYMLAGPLAVVFVCIFVADEFAGNPATKRSIAVAAAALLIAVACPIVAHSVFPYALKRFFIGLHYVRPRDEFPLLVWLAAAASVSAVIAGYFRTRKADTFAGILAYAGVLAVAMALLVPFHGRPSAQVQKYDMLLRAQDWDGLVKLAKKDPPRSEVPMACRNLALAKKNVLADRLMDLPQHGVDCLLPPFEHGFYADLISGEVCYHIGLESSALRLFFEANESQPDYRHSVRCYRRMAESNMLMGSYEAAAKYLAPLRHTLFYRGWADRCQSLLSDPAAIEAHEEYGPIKDGMPKGFDMYFSVNEMQTTLSMMTRESDNKMAAQYALAFARIAGNIKTDDGFQKIKPLDR